MPEPLGIQRISGRICFTVSLSFDVVSFAQFIRCYPEPSLYRLVEIST